MNVTFNQPAFIPWGGFFARLLNSDRMVLLDETILARGFSYVNRNRICYAEFQLSHYAVFELSHRGALI